MAKLKVEGRKSKRRFAVNEPTPFGWFAEGRPCVLKKPTEFPPSPLVAPPRVIPGESEPLASPRIPSILTCHYITDRLAPNSEENNSQMPFISLTVLT